MFDQLETLPANFLTIRAKEIASILPRPTLIRLHGRKPLPLFVSILLHGNEDAGLLAVQELIARYRHAELPRSLTIFVGNVESCGPAVRFLPHQVDFNRAWPGSELKRTPTHELLEQVTESVAHDGVFASIDLHNNTGHNPVYGCICSTTVQNLYLASLFSRTVVYFTRPRGVQTQALGKYCPAMTCECGQIGDPYGVRRATDLLDACLHLSEFPDHQLDPTAVDVYHTVARIRVREACSFGFTPEYDVVLRGDLDSLNFQELDAGETLGTLRGRLEDCFEVNDESGNDVTAQYLSTVSQQVRLGRSAMPSMFTRNLDVIRQDCLGYLMQRYPLPR